MAMPQATLRDQQYAAAQRAAQMRMRQRMGNAPPYGALFGGQGSVAPPMTPLNAPSWEDARNQSQRIEQKAGDMGIRFGQFPAKDVLAHMFSHPIPGMSRADRMEGLINSWKGSEEMLAEAARGRDVRWGREAPPSQLRDNVVTLGPGNRVAHPMTPLYFGAPAAPAAPTFSDPERASRTLQYANARIGQLLSGRAPVSGVSVNVDGSGMPTGFNAAGSGWASQMSDKEAAAHRAMSERRNAKAEAMASNRMMRRGMARERRDAALWNAMMAGNIQRGGQLTPAAQANVMNAEFPAPQPFDNAGQLADGGMSDIMQAAPGIVGALPENLRGNAALAILESRLNNNPRAGLEALRNAFGAKTRAEAAPRIPGPAGGNELSFVAEAGSPEVAWANGLRARIPRQTLISAIKQTYPDWNPPGLGITETVDPYTGMTQENPWFTGLKAWANPAGAISEALGGPGNPIDAWKRFQEWRGATP